MQAPITGPPRGRHSANIFEQNAVFHVKMKKIHIAMACKRGSKQFLKLECKTFTERRTDSYVCTTGILNKWRDLSKVSEK